MMKALRLVILFNLLAAGLFSTTLFLRESAVVHSGLVRLRDVASFSSDDMDASLANVILAVAPDLGAFQVLQREEIYEKLVGNGLPNPDLRGAAAVRIERRGREVNGAYFQAMIEAYVRAHSRWGVDASLTIAGEKRYIIPDAAVAWQVIPANGEDFFGQMLFRVTARSGGEELFSGWVTARLRIEKNVAVSNRLIQKDEAIAATDIRWEKREIDAFCRNALFTEAELFSRRAGRIIRPNSVITADMLANEYFVHRGETATLAVKYKGVWATVAVTALSNGRQGEYVRVLNTSSKKVLFARVCGQGQLEVIVP